MPRAALGLAVFLVVCGAESTGFAQSTSRAPAEPPAAPSATFPPPADPSLATTPVTNLPAVLGAPVLPANLGNNNTQGAGQPGGISRDDTDRSVIPYPGNAPSTPRKRGAVFALPGNEGTPASFQVPDPGPAPSPPVDPNDFLRSRTAPRDPPPSISNQLDKDKHSSEFGGEFGEKLTQLLGKPCEWFLSDHAFDGFISPVTNPFLFEDPRSLTEVRPIFTIEQIPGSQRDFHGGNNFFFGTQLRLAITDRLSFTINKFGLQSFNPDDDPYHGSGTSFAEFWFGPKYTFIRDEATGTLLAGGLQFQVPTGSHQAFQDTGGLSLVPYVSYAQNFGRDLRYGSFNGMAAAGYSASVNNERSSYFYLSGHIDMNVLNQNHWFPLFEMNWFMYTTNGNTTPIGTEGQDLINFGGRVAGQGLLSSAFGLRYKFNEHYQIGGAFEIPFAGPHDLMDYRFTLDFIFRY